MIGMVLNGSTSSILCHAVDVAYLGLGGNKMAATRRLNAIIHVYLGC